MHAGAMTALELHFRSNPCCAESMPPYDLLIPITLAPTAGFFNVDDADGQAFDGHPVEIRVDVTGTYIVIKSLDEHDAPDLLDKVAGYLPWAALQMNLSMVCEEKELRHANPLLADAQFPTLYPTGAHLKLTRAAVDFQNQEGDTLLIWLLNEASQIQNLMPANLGRRLKVALEIFASIDFETSANSRFVGLTTILEMLAGPAPLRAECTTIIDATVKEIDQAKANATAAADLELAEALNGLRKSSQYWRRESFRSSIRRLVRTVSEAFKDANPQAQAREAVALYDKRSKLVHDGITVSWSDVMALRNIARKSLAFAAGHPRLIRP